MKILSAQDIQKVDRYTIEHEPIASIDLMERAAYKCTEWIVENYTNDKSFHFVCGTGNNGGDGFAIARMLFQKGYKVSVTWVHFSLTFSEDCQVNVELLAHIGLPFQILNEDNQIINFEEDCIVDAIFGIGLNKPSSGIAKRAIQQINASTSAVISIDIPSGLMCEDNANNPLDGIVKAHITLTFQQPKLSFLLPDTGIFVGEFHVLDISLNQSYIETLTTHYYFLTTKDVVKLVPIRSKFSHKGTYGHALLCAGSYGKMGAAVLAGKSALRSGVGLLTLHIPNCGYDIVQSTVPEAMVITDKYSSHLSMAWENFSIFSAVGIGPGLGTNEETVKFVHDVLHSYTRPMVIDADAINILGSHPTLLEKVPKNSIFTPHLKEFKRLLQLTNDDFSSFEILELQRTWSIENQHILILKGAHTSISLPNGELWFNSTGNPGMATGGSGDVLTGILTALLAQDMEVNKAALLGVYAHGLAGDLAMKQHGQIGVIASDIIQCLPMAFEYIKKASV